MKELEAIALFRKHLPVPHSQRNQPHTSDSEIVRIGGETIALSVDDYSCEDGFPEHDPANLGWNLAVATLSDIIATGAEPRFLMHSVVLPPDFKAPEIEALAAGIGAALDAFGASHIGGDIGTGPQWRYSGVGVGTFSEEVKPLSRLVSCPSGTIWITGAIGDGNLAAAGLTRDLSLECRLPESRAIARTCGACMDTSDGLASSLATVAQLNPSLRIEVELSKVPYDPRVPEAAKWMGAPEAAFIMGSAGEYELLAFMPAGATAPPGGSFRRMGRFSSGGEAGLFFVKKGGRCAACGDLPDPRDFQCRHEYMQAVTKLAGEMFG